MTDKEKLGAIRAEIHRLVDVRGYDREMANDLFAFMDSLPNEPVSEDLEEHLKWFLKEYYNYDYPKQYKEGTGSNMMPHVIETAIHFANWQKEQMMAKAIDGIAKPDDDEVWCGLKSFNFKDGDKVKVIVIKED